MAKIISPAELAGIVVALLTTPEKMGELEDAESFARFFGDIAEVVANHCGGSVGDVAPPENHGDEVTPYFVTIRDHETLPSVARNVWASADPDGFEGVSDDAGSDRASIRQAYREALTTVAVAVAALSARFGGESVVQAGRWDRHADHPTERPYRFRMDDQRTSNGQLYADLSGDKGEDDCLAITMEVHRFDALTGVRILNAGSEHSEKNTPCVHVHFDDNGLAFSAFKWGDALLLRPEAGVRMTRERFGNEVCWRIER